MNCPRDPNPGEPITATYMRQVVRYVRSLTPFAGPGVKIRRSSAGTHFTAGVTGTKVAESTEVGPFRLRKVVRDLTKGIAYTGWEIYLPPGCLSVNASCTPINIQAYRTNSTGTSVTEEPTDWYRIPFPDITPADGTICKVTVHAKVGDGRSRVDAMADWNKCLMFAEIHLESASYSQSSDPSWYGDDLSVDVATITFSADDDGNVTPSVRRAVTRPVAATVTRNRDMEISWGFYVNPSDLKLTVEKMLIRNQYFTAGGATYVGNTLTEIPLNTTDVYLRITASTSPYTGTIECHNSNSGASAPTAGSEDILVQLYVLSGGRVTADLRESARNIQLYRA